MEIDFVLNGRPIAVDAPPTRTLLDWLREDRGLTGTKEGCNEGDCGACSVMVTAPGHLPQALNACILFLPQLQGKAVRTVEGIAGPKGQHHPVQQAMIDHHGAQCGFCTPGFITTMAAAHAAGRTDHDTELAGNLCRCTGYTPIVRAAEAAASHPVPDWIAQDSHPTYAATPRLHLGDSTRGDAPGAGGQRPPPPLDTGPAALPQSADDLAHWYAANPEGTLIAGATDVGLWVTKGLKQLGPIAFLGRCSDLQEITMTDTEIRIGAAVTLTALLDAIGPHHPSFGELIRRYASVQVRNAATIGGNIANGSPIGDGAPALIALGARVHLRHTSARRDMPIEDFFVDYGHQDRQPGEFVEAITIPRQDDHLRCYKISKRFDQDISAICGCFNIAIEEGRIATARIGFGGMAGTPKRALAVETALVGATWSVDSIEAALPAFEADFAPISDMRASARYRMTVARNLLKRVFIDAAGLPTHVLEVKL